MHFYELNMITFMFCFKGWLQYNQSANYVLYHYGLALPMFSLFPHPGAVARFECMWDVFTMDLCVNVKLHRAMHNNEVNECDWHPYLRVLMVRLLLCEQSNYTVTVFFFCFFLQKYYKSSVSIQSDIQCKQNEWRKVSSGSIHIALHYHV